MLWETLRKVLEGFFGKISREIIESRSKGFIEKKTLVVVSLKDFPVVFFRGIDEGFSGGILGRTLSEGSNKGIFGVLFREFLQESPMIF